MFYLLTGALMIVCFQLALWGLDDVNFHFCERVYNFECRRKSSVSVGVLVCCVVLCRD